MTTSTTERPVWPHTVATRWGEVRGGPGGHGTVAWLGVPFGAPPVGDLRWRAPRPPVPWDTVRECSSYAPAPWQPNQRKSSEDCLYLNVWRPGGARDGLPVYVWIPGGANQVQVPALSDTPAALLASRSEVVVVTVSYRVNALGWLTHPALREGRDGADDSGNYGTLDILAALGWIRDNVEAFGGDPANVLVTGESAGAYNTLTMLISPLARGLFHKGMAQSGRTDTNPPEAGDERAEQMLRRLLEAEHGSEAAAGRARAEMTDRDVAGFLRSREPAQLAAAGRGRLPAGFRDGHVLHADGFDALAHGDYPNKVPMIVGMNQEEAKFQLARNRELLEDRELYEAVARAASDQKRATGCDAVLRRLAANPDQPPVYGYLFLWGYAGGDHPSPLPDPLDWQTGAAHGMDIAFFLHGGDRVVMTRRGFTDQNRPGRLALAEAMMAYVREFAHQGDPGQPLPDVPRWEPWSNAAGAPKLIHFDADAERRLVRMGHDELTLDDVRAAVEALPETVRTTARRTGRVTV